jgi:putative phosphoribosyl transferase
MRSCWRFPAGGVPVAARIASTLSLPLQAAPVSKALLPWTTESGFGAVAFDGSVWLDQDAIESYGLRREQITKAVADARAKVERRRARFCNESLDFKGKTAILVDDGIAAGSTMRTAIAALRKLADEIVCADIRGGTRFAVADAYEEWRDLSDDEVEAMLER